jgi:hypothetical protein
VQPSSGRTVFQLASSANTALFSTELTAFAQAVGAAPQKQIVLVPVGAGSGWLAHQPCRAGAQPPAPVVLAGLLA